MTNIPLLAKNTSVFILAAGRGERMRPLTDKLPKPLLHVNGKSLLEHHLTRLKTQGFRNIVINIDHLGDKIIDAFGDGHAQGLNIRYSDERSTGALETAGGIARALTMLESDAFIVINGDVWTHFSYTKLLSSSPQSATIVLVDNPAHNRMGDFSISSNNNTSLNATAPTQGDKTYTYSGIGIYRKAFFSKVTQGKSTLAPLLYEAVKMSQLGALICDDEWFDIGTPERLEEINRLIKKRNTV